VCGSASGCVRQRVRHCMYSSVCQCARYSYVRSVCSVRGSVRQHAWKCVSCVTMWHYRAVRQCVVERGAECARQCVRQCVAVRVHQCVAVRMVVCAWCACQFLAVKRRCTVTTVPPFSSTVHPAFTKGVYITIYYQLRGVIITQRLSVASNAIDHPSLGHNNNNNINLCYTINNLFDNFGGFSEISRDFKGFCESDFAQDFG
jgi:hypothetical protein